MSRKKPKTPFVGKGNEGPTLALAKIYPSLTKWKRNPPRLIQRESHLLKSSLGQLACSVMINSSLVSKNKVDLHIKVYLKLSTHWPKELGWIVRFYID